MSDGDGEDDKDVSPIDRLMALYYRAPTGEEPLHLQNEDDED